MNKIMNETNQLIIFEVKIHSFWLARFTSVIKYCNDA